MGNLSNGLMSQDSLGSDREEYDDDDTTLCKSCGVEIRFEQTDKGKWMPMEVSTNEPHWGNCPGADKHRNIQMRNDENVEKVEGEEYELQDLVDDAIAMGHHVPSMINDFVYQFDQGGRKISGLTAASYQQLALHRNISTVSVEKEMLKDGVQYTVCVALAEKEVLPDMWVRKWGTAYQPFKDSRGKADNFCFQKAMTKAERNAIKRLIDATDQIKAIDTFLKLPTQQRQQAIPPAATPTEGEATARLADQDNPLDRKRRAFFAKYNERKDALEASGITEDMLRQGMYERYGVKSRADMEAMHYDDAMRSLDINGNFADWIDKLKG